MALKIYILGRTKYMITTSKQRYKIDRKESMCGSPEEFWLKHCTHAIVFLRTNNIHLMAVLQCQQCWAPLLSWPRFVFEHFKLNPNTRRRHSGHFHHAASCCSRVLQLWHRSTLIFKFTIFGEGLLAHFCGFI